MDAPSFLFRSPGRRAGFAATRLIIDATLAEGKDQALGAVGACFTASDRLADAEAGTACGAGCGWCCHQPVEVSVPEVLFIADRLRGQPGDATHRRLDRAARRACQFLDDQRCAIYPIRPFKCRGMLQPDSRWCMQTFAKIDPPEGGPPIDHRPITGPRDIHDGAQLGLVWPFHRAGLVDPALDFIPALRAVIDRPEATAAWLRGEDPFPAAVKLRRSLIGDQTDGSG
jgi:hypothetical protein